MKLLREPLLHFLLLGGALFAASAILGDEGREERGRILVTRARIEQLRSGFERTWRRPPTRGELEGLIEDHVREEVLCREALAMGLDEDDTIIRRRLRQKMEFLTEEFAAALRPTEQQLRDFLADHPEPFRVEPRLALRQVHVAGDRARAHRILAALAAGDADPAALSDSRMLPCEVPLSPHSEIARVFGEDFALRVGELEPGRWHGPLESGYGLHLVRVDGRVPGRVPELHEVRAAVEREWQAARRREFVGTAYGRLKARYEIVVEPPEAP